MAYIHGYVVQGLCVFPAGRQPREQQVETVSQSDGRLASYRDLAWRQLDVYPLGGVYGLLISAEKFTKFPKRLGVFSHLYTMFFVVLGWVLFRSDSISQAGRYLMAMFGFGVRYAHTGAVNLLLHYGGIFILIGIICCFPLKKLTVKLKKAKPLYEIGYAIVLLTVFALSMLYVVKGGYNPFIYFNF